MIAEKPKAAEKIATALGSYSRCSIDGVPVYLLRAGGSDIVIVTSAGHLFGPDTRVRGLPVTEIRWAPLWQFDPRSRHLRRFYYVLSKVVPRARSFINACDYDIEGSTIGYMIIRNFGDPHRAKRMKFSSLTPTELRKAFVNMTPLDVSNSMAGMARAELDWLWGINVSRLLIRAYTKASGRWRSLSAGRVQTPTLAEAVRRWKEINTYVPMPRFSLRATLAYGSAEVQAVPKGWAPSTRSEAIAIAEGVKKGGYMTASRYQEQVLEVRPPPPFNLTDLQEEAARIYGLSPYRTQEIAEELYLAALISYPRTNSQRLPSTLNYSEVLNALASNPRYSSLIKRLVSETGGHLQPRQGEKDDPAHPAIYPTGERPERLDRDHERVYDLVVRRFLAAFAKSAMIARRSLLLTDVDGRAWVAEGEAVVREGWLAYYSFSRPAEKELSRVPQGSRLKVQKVVLSTLWPPSRVQLSRLALLRWMEANDLGTKGTRARIIETLYRRGFLRSGRARTEVTDLGYAVYRALSAVAKELTSVELTRSFEEQLEMVAEGRATKDAVVSKAKDYISSLVGSVLSKGLDVLGTELVTISEGGKGPRCKLCSRAAGPSGLCELHEEALMKLRATLPEVARALGVGKREALAEIAKRSTTGTWVKEVAKAILSGSLDWPEDQ